MTTYSVILGPHIMGHIISNNLNDNDDIQRDTWAVSLTTS